MFNTVFLIGSLVAVVFGQSCDPLKITSPCDAGMPCQQGSTCDVVLGSCCLNADLLTTTVAAGNTVTSSSSTVFGSTVTSRTSTGTGCVDQTNPTTGVSDCAARRNLCNDTTYYDLMTQQCPRTCNRCSSVSTTPSTGSCVDLKNPRTGTSDCASMAAYCNDSVYINLMRIQCPRTCGFCGSSSSTVRFSSTVSSGTCADQINPSTGRSDCSANRALCNNSAYQSLMRTQCPRTCGFC